MDTDITSPNCSFLIFEKKRCSENFSDLHWTWIKSSYFCKFTTTER